MTSSIYPLTLSIATPTITANNNILTSDLAINTDLVSPGGGGILRLLFSFTLDTTPSVVSIFNNSSLKGTLNADNNNDIMSNGYYRFDIDVESGDNINLQLESGSGGGNVTAINFIRAHLVQFGAWLLIYSHKPQRSGKSIVSNTNNPPQDPPPPSKTIIEPTIIEPTIVEPIIVSPKCDTIPPSLKLSIFARINRFF